MDLEYTINLTKKPVIIENFVFNSDSYFTDMMFCGSVEYAGVEEMYKELHTFGPETVNKFISKFDLEK